MKSDPPLVLAIGGTVLICLGSFFVIAAPGDGQTGMFAFPLWFFGGWAGLAAIGSVVSRRNSSGISASIIGLALVSIGSVVWGFVAANSTH